jgi:hypothetical protein
MTEAEKLHENLKELDFLLKRDKIISKLYPIVTTLAFVISIITIILTLCGLKS